LKSEKAGNSFLKTYIPSVPDSNNKQEKDEYLDQREQVG